MNQLSANISKLYKEQYPRLVAVLTRIFGVENLTLAEDVVQETFQKAVDKWPQSGVPTNPEAWLTLAAKNLAIDTIRRNKIHLRLAEDLKLHLESEWSMKATMDNEFSDQHIKDDQLKMMFLCCNNDLTPGNQLPIILRLLCGLSIRAIARALLCSEQTIKKRLLRAKSTLKQSEFELPSTEHRAAALSTVHTALYLLFNEGFHSSEQRKIIDISLCEEAIGLVNLLVDVPTLADRETLSLFALMHFHIARVHTRVNTEGDAVPLDLQDRSKWQQDYIDTGNSLLNLSAGFDAEGVGRFYCEALIAQKHCTAKSFRETNWPGIIEAYDRLIELSQSPVAKLNRAVALAYAGDIECAMKEINTVKSHRNLDKSHLASACLAHCYAMLGNRAQAMKLAREAEQLGGTETEHRLMYAQIERALST